jgi:ABC-type Fe3+/spermidine/putrescine transport system ATPase subunit
MSDQIQVDLRGVTKRYDGAVGVRNMDLQVRRGEFFSLLGPSGCGKSTTLRLIAGFEQADEGDVTIAGRSMRGVQPYARNIGIVFQSYALFPHLDVFENVAFGLRTRRIRGEALKRQVEQALAMVELLPLARRKPHQLSGGQQQRVALARAVVIKPDVLLLDEPLGALDKKLRESMQVRLIELHRQIGITTIYVTHDQEEALTMSDRIAVMSSEVHGIVQLDTPQTLYRHPRSLFVANFIGTSNILPDHVNCVENGLVRTDRGLVASVTGVGLLPGSRIFLTVRPEKISIAKELETAPPGTNQLTGIIESVVFLGDSTTYLIRVGDVVFRAKQFVDSNTAEMTAGARVLLSWLPQDTTAFPADARPLIAIENGRNQQTTHSGSSPDALETEGSSYPASLPSAHPPRAAISNSSMTRSCRRG